MMKIILVILMFYACNYCLAFPQQHLQQLQQTDQRIQQQSKQIASLLNQYRLSPNGKRDWLLSRSVWVHEFDVLDSLRLGINSVKLYLSTPANNQQSLYALVAHHNLYIAARMCTESASEINQYRYGLQSIPLKQALQKQFEQAKQGCHELRQVGAELYMRGQLKSSQSSIL